MKHKIKVLLLLLMLLSTVAACRGDKEKEEGILLPTAPAAEFIPDDALTAQRWQWVQFLDQATGTVNISNTQNYTVGFQRDGTVQVKADCNDASGSYTSDGVGISVVLGPVTLVGCSPESLGDKFLGYLSGAAMYRVENGRLQIELANGGGMMTFISANGSVPTAVSPSADNPVSIVPTAVSPSSGTVMDSGARDHAHGTYVAPHYTVAGGDTLYSVSLRFNLSPDQIKAANTMSDDALYTDQQLIIPGANLNVTPLPSTAAYERITFASGATAATVDTVLTNGQSKQFILSARAGQTMQITTHSSAEFLIISVTDTNGAILPINGVNGQANNNVSGVLPVDGDYHITITPTTSPESPTMAFNITFTVQ